MYIPFAKLIIRLQGKTINIAYMGVISSVKMSCEDVLWSKLIDHVQVYTLDQGLLW